MEGRREIDNSAKNGQINHDSIFVGLDMIKPPDRASEPNQQASRISDEYSDGPDRVAGGSRNDMRLKEQQQFAFSLLVKDYNPYYSLTSCANFNHQQRRKPV